jgi:hypothetical protein
VAVTAAWAGLAPYYPGLYQVNFQAPPNLPAGELRLQVRCGQQVSQDLVVSYGAKPASEPSDIVGLLLEAQARGDVNGVLSYWAMEEKALPAQQMVRERFEMVRRVASFSNVRYQPLATVRGDQGTISAVRGFVDYTIATRDGTRTLRQGLLAVLRKIQGAWKVTALAPDDLLNLELTVESASAVSSARLASGSVNIKEINAAINSAMGKGYINEEKAALSGLFAAVGKAPGVGDAVANIYQVLDTLNNVHGTLAELWQYGPFSSVLLVKGQQVALGVAQIVTEFTPGLDTTTDAMAASLEQLTYNLEILRALQELKKTLLNLPASGVRLNPRLFPVKGFEWDYPAGLEFNPAEGAQHSYGVPLGSISLFAPTVLGRSVPLQVIGELAIDSSSSAYPVAGKLGAELRNEVYFLPVDVGHLVEGDSLSGDTILDGWSRRRNASSTAKWAVWDITCRRGTQLVAVRLRTGETTPPVTIRNSYMNAVQSLQIQGAPATEPFKLAVGSQLKNLRVIGVGPFLEERFQPDLTSLGQCLDMTILDTTVAGIERSQSVTLSGIKKGQTTWRLLLGGSANEPGIGDVSRDVRIDVEPAASFSLRKFSTAIGSQHNVLYLNSKMGVVIRGLTVDNLDGTIPLQWNGNTFSAAGTYAAGTVTQEMDVTGVLDPANKRLVEMHANQTWTNQTSSEDKFVLKVKIDASNVTFQNFSSTYVTWQLQGPAAATAVDNGTFKIVASGTVYRNAKLVPAESWEYISTDWSDGAISIYLRY